MQRISGLPDAQIDDWERRLEAQMVVSLQTVMDKIAARIAKIQVASAYALVAVATTGPTGDDDPPPQDAQLQIPDPEPVPKSIPPAAPGAVPGQPYISPDDLASIAPLWQEQVASQLLPLAAQVFMDSAGHVRSEILDAAGAGPLVRIPALGSQMAEQYLARAKNSFEEVGDHLWATARAQLSQGFDAGESIPQLADRLRQSAGLSARTGVLVARSQVIDASNNGSISMARLSALKMQKEWISTVDVRVRPEHLAADGQRRDLNEPFTVGGYPADYPAAPSLPPAMRYNCRCTVGYVMPDKPKAAEDVTPPAQAAELADLPGTSGVEIALPEVAAPAAVRSALASAKTLPEVDAVAMAEARRLTGRDIRFDQRGSDVEIARQHAEGILRGLERYPESPLSQVGTYGPGSSAEAITRARGMPDFDEPKAFTATLPGNDVVLFNVRMASDPQAYLEALERGHGARWHTNGTATPMGQALHEFGHTVDETFTEAGAKVGAVRSQITGPFTGKAYKEQIRTEIGRYAASSSHELGAEAFADVMINGEAASATSRAVFDAIEAGYARIHPRVGGVFPRPAAPGDGLPAYGTEKPSYVRPSLQAAKTPRQLRRVWQDEVEAITGFPFLVDAMPRGISMVTAREYAEGTLQMFAQFPAAKVDRIHWFDDAASSSYAQVRRGGHALEFNMKYASEAGRPKFLAARRRDAAGWDNGGATSWGVRNDTTAQGVVYHEFTHILDIENGREAIHGQIVPLLIRHAQREGVTDIDDLIKRQISSYATKNYQEMVAEAGADVMVNGAAASQLSHDIFDLLRAEYRRRGFEIRSAPALDADLEDLGGEVFPKAAASERELAELARETPSRVTPLEGGISAKVERLDYASGESAVRKDYLATRAHPESQSAKIFAESSTTAEDLASQVLRAVGVRAPAVVKLNDHSLLMEFVEGRQGGETGALKAPAKIVASAEGRRLGLADAIMGHRDRGGGNWMRAPDGGIVAIDNGGAFGGVGPDRAAAGNPFTSFLMGGNEHAPWKAKIELPSDIDLAQIRRDLASLKPRFDAVGYQRQFRDMMGRLDEIEKRSIRVPPVSSLAQEVAPAKTLVAPPGKPLAKMTVAELRAEARARGITVPAGTRKPDLVRMVDEAPSASPVPASISGGVADPLAARRAALARLVDEPIVSTHSLSGGHISTADVVTTRDGKYVVKDSIPEREGGPVSFSGRTSAQLTDAEVLGSDIYAAVGGRAPAVLRISDERVVQELVEGRTGTEVALGKKKIESDADQVKVNQESARLAATPEGRLRGLAKVLLGEGDTNADNWFVDSAGHIWSIDHGGARWVEESYYGLDSAWTRQFLDQKKRDGSFAPHSISPGDMAVIRERLAALEPKFAELGRQDWFASVMRRADALAAKATGEESILGGNALEVAARARQAVIDERRVAADALTEVRTLLDRSATQRALTSRADALATRASELDALAQAMRSGDAVRIRSAVDDLAARQKLTEVGAPPAGQDWVAFDPRVHEVLPGLPRPNPGALVRIDKPGWVADVNGETVQLSKAAVEPLDAAEIKALQQAPAEAARRSTALPPGVAQRQAELREDAARPVTSDDPIYGGGSAYTRKVEHEGGPPTIVKDTSRASTKAEAKHDADAEELGALTSEAVGIRAPAVSRAGPFQVEMEFLEGKPGGGGQFSLARPAGTDYLETDDGRMMGLLDYLTGNPDRSDSNWLLLPNGRLGSIDMGDAFRAPKLAGTRDVFGSNLVLDETGKWRKVIDISPADLAVIRTRLEALAPEFDRLGRAAWHRQVMARLAEVEKRADPNAAIRLAEAVRPDPAVAKAAQRAAARAQAATITAQRGNAALLARIDELVQAKATKAVIRQELDPALREAEQLYAGADSAVADALRTAVDSGDAAKIRAALTRQSKASGLTPIGKAGAKAKFDSATMEGVGGTAIPDGADVIVVRRGAKLAGIETPEKAVVRRAGPDLEEQARTRVRIADDRRATSKFAGSVYEGLLDSEADAATLVRMIEQDARTFGIDEATSQVVIRAARSGDVAEVEAALAQVAKAAKITRLTRPGDMVSFDRATMEELPGSKLRAGQKVRVVRPAYSTVIDGKKAQLGKSMVEELTPEEIRDIELAAIRAKSTEKTVAKGDFVGLTRVGEQMGGNPGGIFEAGDGSRWYVKAARNPEQLRSEALALDLYRTAGLDVPEVVLGQGLDELGAGTQIASRIVEGATADLRRQLADDAYRAQLQEGFAVDAWLGNWDVLGASLDNVLTTAAGAPIRIEAGGALRWRALGGSKDFGPDVVELDTLRARGRSAAAAFGDMTPEQLVASAERVRKVTPAKIKALVKKHGLDPELADTLIARRADILRRAEALAGPKPLTPQQYAAKLKTAKKGQEALDAATFNVEDRATLDALTSQEADALLAYRSGNFTSINDALRALPGAEKKQLPEVFARVPQRTRAIDDVFDRARLTEDAELWRAPGSGRGIFGDPSTWGDDLAGFEWVDPAYSSASASRTVGDWFARDGGMRLRLLTPKGSKAIRLSGWPAPGSIDPTKEAEVLLARGARFRVVKDRGWVEIAHPARGRGAPKIRVRDLDVEVIVPDQTPPLPWATK